MENKIKVYLTFIFVIILSVVIFSGCSGNRYPRELILADNIADKEPKRAIAKLDRMKPQIKDAGEAVKNYYTLLRIKANDKAYAKHTSDTTILRLVDYYEKGGDKKLLPMAYYYAGRVYFDLNNYPEALKYFQKVTEMSGEENPLTYKAYSQMGSIFLYQDLYDKGIEAFTKACKYNEKVDNKENLIYELGGIADCYKMKKDKNKALLYLKKALAISEEVGNKMMTHSILAQIADLYYKQEEYSIALFYIQKVLKHVDMANMRSIYSIATDIYKEIGKNDSVFLLCNELYKINDVYAKHFASKNLGNYFLEKHDAPMALHYLRQYELFSDSIQVITQTQAIAKANTLYNYQIKEKEIATLNAEVKEKRYIIFIISIFTVAIILLLILYVLNIKKKRHIESIKSERIKEKLEQSKVYIEDNVRKINELKMTVATLEEKDEKLISLLKLEEEKLMNMNKMAEIKIENNKIAEEGIGTSEIYNKIWAIYNSNIPNYKKKLSREDWEMLDIEVNRYFPDFKNFLLETCKITTYEYKVCLLIKIKIPPVGISIFINKTKPAISLTRKRLYKKVFGNDATPNKWDDFILSL